jgi:uncharacterized protein YegL
MKGEPLQDLKRSLQAIVSELHEFKRTKFNVIIFGSNWQTLFPVSQSTQDSKATQIASALVDKLTPNGGGTELYEPLKAIFSLSPAEDALIPKNIFILTDGHPTNTEQVDKYTKLEDKKRNTENRKIKNEPRVL